MQKNHILYALINTLKTLCQSRRLLYSTTKYELQKKYAGHVLGYTWLILYPLLFLSVYLFLWLVVFKTRFPGYSELDYVVFVFCGLVPFLFFSEVVTASTLSIKQNMHLIKNVIMPVDLIPARTVSSAMLSYFIGIVLLIFLSLINNTLSWNILFIFLIILLQVLFLLGLCFLLAPLGLLLPDVSNIVNLIVMFLMFLSPIGFKPEMVPEILQFVVLINPVSYMLEAFRVVIMGQALNVSHFIIFFLISICFFGIGASVFQRFKNLIVEFE
jgi:lipopolysaccharide transport system permease protein